MNENPERVVRVCNEKIGSGVDSVVDEDSETAGYSDPRRHKGYEREVSGDFVQPKQ